MNPGKEEGKEREGGDDYEVAGRGALPASPECLLRPVRASLGSGLSALTPITLARQLR